MGRLIVEQILTADGFACGPDGELDFMRMPGPFDPTDPGQLDMLEHTEAILLGRTTYELFAAYWPDKTTDDEPMADHLNRLPKHVVTNTLAAAPWGSYSSAIVEHGEPRDTARRLKLHYAGDIVVWGSLQLAGALLQAELVDRVRLRIVPILIGQGRTATPGLRHPRGLDLVEAEMLPAGHVTLTYDVR
ncbi:dihydrofolate reductase family protein [Demequina sp. SYSU T00068]|uniref:dihydrofolate reductase family protein n=1 Tax=Demequina lignilytica TaxID=3051663 RepID=UPI00262A07A7|nr:dihydrofolate reductase family protein [Demequina sp. SYSU T00068]MDN4490386.1 dihydrofolate reductase family protein [Demequina sp. SYSU T00068]